MDCRTDLIHRSQTTELWYMNDSHRRSYYKPEWYAYVDGELWELALSCLFSDWNRHLTLNPRNLWNTPIRSKNPYLFEWTLKNNDLL